MPQAENTSANLVANIPQRFTRRQLCCAPFPGLVFICIYFYLFFFSVLLRPCNTYGKTLKTSRMKRVQLSPDAVEKTLPQATETMLPERKRISLTVASCKLQVARGTLQPESNHCAAVFNQSVSMAGIQLLYLTPHHEN